MAARKPKPVKVTAAVVKGIKSGQIPKQTLALKQGPTKSVGYVRKKKLVEAPKPTKSNAPKRPSKTTIESFGNGVYARQRKGNTMSYSMFSNNGNGTISVDTEYGQRRKRPGDSSGATVIKAPSTKAKNTGGAMKRAAAKRKGK